MNKKYLSMFFLTFICLFYTTKIYAAKYSINEIYIVALLNDDGSANIKEVWDVNVTSGTEWYIVKSNMNGRAISDLTVHDENNTLFENVDIWDTDKTIEQKQNKSGIVINADGYELCWGIGAYGSHKYTVNYKIDNFITSFSDYDGFNYTFVSSGLSAEPQKVTVVISAASKKLIESDVAVWSFGFKGESFFYDSEIIATSADKLKKNNKVIVLVRLQKGIINPTNQENSSFESVLNYALKDSDYEKKGSSSIVFNVIINNIRIVAILILWIGSYIYRKSKLNIKKYRKLVNMPHFMNKSYIKEIPYNRNIPFNGHIPEAYYALAEFDKTPKLKNIIEAYFLKWMIEGYISFEQDIANGAKSKIIFNEIDNKTQESEKELFYILYSATTSGVLYESKIKSWTKRNYKKLIDWEKSYLIAGRNMTENDGLGAYGLLNKQGLVETVKTFGLKNYLTDFSIIHERYAIEVGLWDNYLIFASLLGISKQVQKDFENLSPEYFEKKFGDDSFYYSMRSIDRMSYTFYSTKVNATRRTRGGGGRSSLGGGGGSFGGGGDGGSR